MCGVLPLAEAEAARLGLALRQGRAVRGLRHRVGRAAAADGNHDRAGGDGPCRSLVRSVGQLGGAAEQRLRRLHAFSRVNRSAKEMPMAESTKVK